MELSSLVTEGLGMCGESSKLGDRSFRVLVREVFEILLQQKDENALSGKHIQNGKFLKSEWQIWYINYELV